MNLISLSRWVCGVSLGGMAGVLMVSLMPSLQASRQDKAPEEQTSIHKTLESFVAAFNANDPKGLAKNLTQDVEYIDEASNHIVGSKPIEDVLTSYFRDNKGAQLEITPAGVRVVAPGVALEDGEAVITVPETHSQTARRIALVYVKQDGAWKIASYREFPEAFEEPGDPEPLKALEFLLGEWVDESPEAKVSTSFTLSKDKSHILRDFVITQGGQETLRGSQRIAIDPQTGLIKGWTFDSANGHGESTWTPNGDSWLIRGTGVTQDGEIASATYILKQLGPDRIELKTMHKVIGNQVEPDATSILVRKLQKDAAPKTEAKN